LRVSGSGPASSPAAAFWTLEPAIPYLPFTAVFGFVPLPASLLIAVAAITVLYVLSTEILKRRFYRTPA